MKKLILLVCILLLAAVPVLAVEEEGILDGMDYVGDTVGTIGYLQMNVEKLNAALNGKYPLLPEGMLIWGGGSMMGFRDGLRWGGYGFGGEVKQKGANDALTYLVFNLGGAVLDYGFTVTDRFDVGVGGVLGGGGYELTLRKQGLQDLGVPNTIYVKNSYFITGPRVNADFRVKDWLTVQASASYLFGIGDKRWNDVKLKVEEEVLPALRVNGLMATLNFILTF